MLQVLDPTNLEPVACAQYKNVDKRLDGQLAAAHEKTGGSVVAVMNVPREQTKSYGIAAVKPEKDGLQEITGMVEKPRPEDAEATDWRARLVGTDAEG